MKMKSDENTLDALREGWNLYGARLDEALDGCPQPELRFRRDGRRPQWALAAALTVTWLLVTASAVRWMPENEGHAMAGALYDKPDVAMQNVQSILEKI